MNNTKFPLCFALWLLLAVFSVSCVADKPNLLLIIADDCTYLDMEVYGGQASTPNLKKLAQQGMQFSRCFQAAPMCSPTRHNIYTGIYPVKSGAWPNHSRVYPGTKSIAHYLRDAGYRVALSGKTHIGPKESFPFEYSVEFRSADPSSTDPYPELAKLFAESKSAGTPFCLVACSDEPHTPYSKGDVSAYDPEKLLLPPTFVDTAETRREYAKYLAEITYFDTQCGALLNLLDAHNLAETTFVMVISEQGSGFPFAKWTCYELGLASGMIARLPGVIEPGAKSDALVEYVDIAPTFLSLAGAQIPEAMDGQSFLPVLTGDVIEHKTYTFGLQTTRGIGNAPPQYAVRSAGTKTHRYIRNLNHTATFNNVVTRPGGDKADFWMSWIERAESGDPHAELMTARYQKRPAEELYDVEKDPHCLDNLVDDPQYEELKAELSHHLDAWMKSQGDEGIATEALAHTRKARYKENKRPAH
ncbi:MAG: sulfatase [Planctomycetota bacterium]